MLIVPRSFLICLIAAGAFASNTRAPSRTIDLTNETARVAFALELAHEYPRLNALNRTFNRSVLNILNVAATAVTDLSMGREVYEVRPSPGFGISFTENAEGLQYDDDAIAQIRSDLVTRAGVLFESLGRSKTTLKLDLLADDLKTFTGKEPAGLFELLPFLYDRSGHSRYDDLSSEYDQDELVNALLNVSGAELEHYPEVLRHAETTVGPGFVTNRLRSATNNVFDKNVKAKLIKRDATGEVARERRVSIQEVSPLVALIRGTVGIDCSMNSVILHALLRGAKTYWIRPSHRLTERPIGYAFALPVRRAGRVIPFVLTINGPGVKGVHVGPILDLIANRWGSSVVAVPDDEDLEATVNDDDVREALASLRQDRFGTVTPPDQSWRNLDQYILGKTRITKYDNPYSILELGSKFSVGLINARSREIKLLPAVSENLPPDFGQLPTVARARLGARVTRYHREDSKSTQMVSKILDVTPTQMRIAARWFEPWGGINSPSVALLSDELRALDLIPLDLPNLIGTRELARLMQRLILKHPGVLNRAEWQPVTQRVSEDLAVEVDRLGARGQTTAAKKLRSTRRQLLTMHIKTEEYLRQFNGGAVAALYDENPRRFERVWFESVRSKSAEERAVAYRALSGLPDFVATQFVLKYLFTGEDERSPFTSLSTLEQNELLNRTPRPPRELSSEARRTWMSVYLLEKDLVRRRDLVTLMKQRGLWSEFNLELLGDRLARLARGCQHFMSSLRR